MASLRGRFFTSVIKKYFSINPEVCKDPVAKLQRLNKNSVYGGPKGFNKRVIPLENAAIEMYECRKNQNKFMTPWKRWQKSTNYMKQKNLWMKTSILMTAY